MLGNEAGRKPTFHYSDKMCKKGSFQEERCVLAHSLELSPLSAFQLGGKAETSWLKDMAEKAACLTVARKQGEEGREERPGLPFEGTTPGICFLQSGSISCFYQLVTLSNDESDSGLIRPEPL